MMDKIQQDANIRSTIKTTFSLTKDTYAVLNFGIRPMIMLLFNTDI